jgi:molybdopterin synthase catalytic subunit
VSEVVKATVTSDVLQPDLFRQLVSDPSSGAIALFSGDVRNHDGGKTVISLEYEAHPDAQKVLEAVTREVVSEFPNLTKVALAHRYGSIPIGESAFVVSVSAAHRESAFAACQKLVDEVKARIPIWKHQVFADGSDEWVNFA